MAKPYVGVAVVVVLTPMVLQVMGARWGILTDMGRFLQVVMGLVAIPTGVEVDFGEHSSQVLVLHQQLRVDPFGGVVGGMVVGGMVGVCFSRLARISGMG